MSSNSRGRRIHDLDEMRELWPAVLRQMKKRFGFESAAAFFDAFPVAFSQEEVVLEFVRPLLYARACAVVESLAFEQAFNDYLDFPRQLRLRLRD